MRTLMLVTVSAIAVLATTATARINHDHSQAVGTGSSLVADHSAAGDSATGEAAPDAATTPSRGPRPDFNFPCCPQSNPWANFQQEKRCLSAAACDECSEGLFAWLFSFTSKKQPCPSCSTGAGSAGVGGSNGWFGFHFDLFSLFSFNSLEESPPPVDGNLVGGNLVDGDSADGFEISDHLQEQPNGRRRSADLPTSRPPFLERDIAGPLSEEPPEERETLETTTPEENEAPISVRPAPSNPIPATPRNSAPLLPNNPAPPLPNDPGPLRLPRNPLPQGVPRKDPQAETPPADVSERGRNDLYELLLKLR